MEFSHGLLGKGYSLGVAIWFAWCAVTGDSKRRGNEPLEYANREGWLVPGDITPATLGLQGACVCLCYAVDHPWLEGFPICGSEMNSTIK
jgi:hypothetical protein